MTMDRAAYQRATELFLRARVMSGADAETFLARECEPTLRGIIDNLLRHDRSPHSLLSAKLNPMSKGLEAVHGKAHYPSCPESCGPFRIVKEIGRGGMGVVYEAWQDHPSRRVALKIAHTPLADAASAERTWTEADALAMLDHPGIARVYCAGEVATPLGRFAYLAMEYIEGISIAEFASRHALCLRERIALMRDVCSAVSHAHSRGVLHRDIKPSNILVTSDRLPKLVDFGVARHIQGERYTLPGQVLGTPGYASPEQLQSLADVDERADVFSLGVVLRELYSSMIDVLLPSGHHSRPNKEIRAERTLLGAAEGIVEHATHSDRDCRLTSAEEMSRLLGNALRGIRPARSLRRGLTRGRRVVRWALIAASTTGLVWCVYAVFASSPRADSALSVNTQALMSSAGIDPISDWTASGVQFTEPLSESDVRRAVEAAIASNDYPPALTCERLELLFRGTLRLGHPAIALKVIERACEISKEQLGANDRRTIALQLVRVHALLADGQLAPARQLIDTLIDAGQMQVEPLKFIALYSRAQVRDQSRESRLAAADYRTVLDATKAVPSMQALCARASFGISKYLKAHEAVDTLKDGASRVRVLGRRKNDPLLCQLLCELAQRQLQLGNRCAAEITLKDALGLENEADPALVPELIKVEQRLAGLDWVDQRYEEAEKKFRASIERAARIVGPMRFEVEATGRSSLGVCLRDQGKYAEAEAVLREVLRYEQEHERFIGAMRFDTTLNLVGTLLAAKKAGDALSLVKELEAKCEEMPPSGADRRIEMYALMAIALRRTGHNAEARQALENATAERTLQDGASSWRARVVDQARAEIEGGAER